MSTESTARTESNLGQKSEESPVRRYEPIVGQLVDLTTESSQATERDIEKSEFSLQQQSSQDIDEESCLSLNALNQSLSLVDELHEDLHELQELDDMTINNAQETGHTPDKETTDSQQEIGLLQDLSTSESTTTQQLSAGVKTPDKRINTPEGGMQ